jgi:hypothetical protein
MTAAALARSPRFFPFFMLAALFLVLATLAGCGGSRPPAPIEAVTIPTIEPPKEPPPVAPLSQSASTAEEPHQAVQDMPDGLMVTDLLVGKGAPVESGDRVRVLYTGTLDDGTVFDSTARRGNTPFVAPIGKGQLIKGWELGLIGMRAGGKRQLVIPPDLAYGQRSAGPIPPGSTLHFYIELLEIVPASSSTP